MVEFIWAKFLQYNLSWKQIASGKSLFKFGIIYIHCLAIINGWNVIIIKSGCHLCTFVMTFKCDVSCVHVRVTRVSNCHTLTKISSWIDKIVHNNRRIVRKSHRNTFFHNSIYFSSSFNKAKWNHSSSLACTIYFSLMSFTLPLPLPHLYIFVLIRQFESKKNVYETKLLSV